MTFFKNQHIHIIGIKGSGCAALAELLLAQGCLVTGSDGAEKFYTDLILQKHNIIYFEEFLATHITSGIDLIIYSAAYDEQNIELAQAMKLSIPTLSYPQALGHFSRQFGRSVAIAGVHGKTTTTALAGCLIKSLGLPMTVLVGSGVSIFDGSSTYHGGDKAFIAEACEYRRHFLNFNATDLLITSVELDHQDYFISKKDIESAFSELMHQLPAGATVIYCADDEGCYAVVQQAILQRPDINAIAYGFKATGAYQIESIIVEKSLVWTKIKAYEHPFALGVPGHHTGLNTVGVIALITALTGQLPCLPQLQQSLTLFTGSRRRAEIIGMTANNILVMDDYAHHPTAIKTTLSGFKEFYPHRRLVVSFMSHTYSRTVALLDEFAESLDGVDFLILHKIFSSAREHYDGSISGYTLFEKCKERRGSIIYVEEPIDALPEIIKELKPGDLFLTMGAGDNFPLGRYILDYFYGVKGYSSSE